MLKYLVIFNLAWGLPTFYYMGKYQAPISRSGLVAIKCHWCKEEFYVTKQLLMTTHYCEKCLSIP